MAIQGGELTYTRLATNTKLRYVTIDPTSMVRSKPAQLHIMIEKGKGQFRVGTLAQASLIKAMGPMLATAAKGTAYSVAVQGQKTLLDHRLHPSPYNERNRTSEYQIIKTV